MKLLPVVAILLCSAILLFTSAVFAKQLSVDLSPGFLRSSTPEQMVATILKEQYHRIYQSTQHIFTHKLLKSSKVENGMLLYLQQEYENIPVEEAMIKIRIKARENKAEIAYNVRQLKIITPGKMTASQALSSLAEQLQEYPDFVFQHSQKYIHKIIFTQGDTGIESYRILWPKNATMMYRYYVSAENGNILRRSDNFLYGNSAFVFIPSPLESGDLTKTASVTLEDLITNDNGFLESELISTFNCLPTDSDGKSIYKDYFGYQIPVCDEVPKANNIVSGNYQYTPKDPANGDEFSEVNAYYHTTNIYNRFKSLDDSVFTLREKPLHIVVNFLMADFYRGGSSSLAPFDNAMFASRETGSYIFSTADHSGFDSIIFGQGENVDYAYDADIIYHEFTHAAIESYVALMNAPLIDAWGTSFSATSLHEGFADYFASSITNDPVVGNYVGPRMPKDLDITQATEAGIRDIEKNASCPVSVQGEAHADGQIWATALWEIRSSYIKDVNPDVFALDRAFVISIRDKFVPSISFEESANAVIDVIKTEIGESFSKTAESIFISHGLIGCERAIDIQTFQQEYLYIPGTADLYAELNFVPAPLQFKIEVPKNTKSVDLILGFFPQYSYHSGQSDPALSLLLKNKEAIVFEQEKKGVINPSIEISSNEDELLSLDGNNKQAANYFENDGYTSFYKVSFEINNDNICGTTFYMAIINSMQSAQILKSIKAEFIESTGKNICEEVQSIDGGKIADDTDTTSHVDDTMIITNDLDDTSTVSSMLGSDDTSNISENSDEQSTQDPKNCTCSENNSHSPVTVSLFIFFLFILISARKRI